MTNTEASDGQLEHSMPNKMGRIVLLALEEVLGRNSTTAILNLARMQDRIDNLPPNNFDRLFSFQELATLQKALDEMYGPRGGRNLARRVGQEAFRLGIRDFGPLLGIADLAFRVLPLHTKMRIGFEVLAETVNRFTDSVVHISEDEEHFRWTTEQCAVCWGRHTSSPCCHLLLGLLDEGLYWVSGGRSFYIEEVSCIAAGDAGCTVLVGREALD